MIAMLIALALYRLTERAKVPLWHPFTALVIASQSLGRWRIVLQIACVLLVSWLQWQLLPYWASQIVSGLMLAAAFGVAGDIKRLVEGRPVQRGITVASGTMPMRMSDHLVWRHLLPMAAYTLTGHLGLYLVMLLQTTRAPGARRLRWLVLWLADWPLQRLFAMRAPYLLKGIATKLAGQSRENWVPMVMALRTRLIILCCALLIALDLLYWLL